MVWIISNATLSRWAFPNTSNVAWVLTTTIATIKPSDVPKINLWLEYCDRHPDHLGENLVDLAWRFEKESFCWIDQLVGTTVSVEKLLEWLGIGKGMAILLIKYAEEDLKLVRSGKFTMDLVI